MSVHDFFKKVKITVFLPLWENVSKWVYSDRLFHVYGDRIWSVQLKRRNPNAGFIYTFLLFLLLLNCVLVFLLYLRFGCAWPDCTADLCVRDDSRNDQKWITKVFFFFVRDKENREKKKKRRRNGCVNDVIFTSQKDEGLGVILIWL